ncbi:MAG: DUF5667 domain-containing protein [bacterium]|nr:DUF5667 domain-containing protein [bacterium]
MQGTRDVYAGGLHTSSGALLVFATTLAVAFFIGLTVVAPPAHAQEPDAPAAETADESAAVEAAVDAALEEAATADIPEAVTSDAEVSAADLGATDARVLQDSPLYASKRLWRGFRTAMTFNPVKKAERKFQYANQELADAQKLAEDRGGDAGAFADVERAMRQAQDGMREIAADAQQLRERKDRDPEAVERFLDRVANTSFTQQKAMERIAEYAPEEFRAQIAERRDGILEHVGGVMGGVDDPSLLRGRFERALENQRGGEFRNFKSVEVLKQLEQQVPEQAREAIRAAQEHAVSRMAEQIEEDPERFGNYVEHLSGDAVRHFEILDDVRTTRDLPPAFLKQIDAMKAKAVEKFNTEFSGASEGAREHLLRRFEEGDTTAVRVAEQFKHFVPPEVRAEIERREDTSIEKFKAQFAGTTTATGEAAEAVAGEAQQLMRKLRENPEPTDFILLQKLEEKLTPEQRAFVQGLEREGTAQFERQFREGGEQFLDRFVDTSAPQSLEVLEGLRARGVPGLGIDRAIAVQRQRFQEHLNDLENPEILGHIKEAIELDPNLKQQFEAGDPSFFMRIGEQREELMRKGAERRMELEVKMREAFEGTEGDIPEDMGLPPEAMEEFKRRREDFHRAIEGEGVPPEFAPGSFGTPGFDRAPKPLDGAPPFEFRERDGALEAEFRREGRMPEQFGTDPTSPPSPGASERFRALIEEKREELSGEQPHDPSRPYLPFTPDGRPSFGNDFRPNGVGSDGQPLMGPNGKPMLFRPQGEGDASPPPEPRHDVETAVPARPVGDEPQKFDSFVAPPEPRMRKDDLRGFRPSEPQQPVEMRREVPFERFIEGRGDGSRPEPPRSFDAPDARGPAGGPGPGPNAGEQHAPASPLGILAPLKVIAALVP